MPKKIDLTGQKFGYLVVIGESKKRSWGQKCWFCECACGNLACIRQSSLRRGEAVSCGCYRKQRIGEFAKNNTKPIEERVSPYKTISRRGEGSFRFVHRKTMEDYLGRKLGFNEIVHHINGDTFDNRIENLEILSRAEHSRLHNKGSKHKPGSKARQRQSREVVNKRKLGWERSGKNKMTRKKVAEIRDKLARGATERAMAEEYGVTKRHINDIKNKKTWID